MQRKFKSTKSSYLVPGTILQHVLKSFLLLGVYLVGNILIGNLMGTNETGIYHDYRKYVSAFLQGEFMGARYPPIHVIWCALRQQVSLHLGISYFFVSLILYVPIHLLIWTQLRAISSEFITSTLWQKCVAWAFILYPLYFLSLHFDLALPIYTLFLLLSTRILLRSLNETAWQRELLATLLAGICLGFASLVRPTPMLLPIVLFIPFYFHKPTSHSIGVPHKMRTLAKHAFFILVFATTIFPWSYYATQNSGQLVFLSTGFTPSHRDGFSRFPPTYTRESIYPYMQNIPDAIEFHKKELVNNTAIYISVWLRKLILAWYGSDSGNWNGWFACINIPILILALIGSKPYWRKASFALVGIIILYHWVLSIIVLSIARYQVPVVALILIFTVLGFKKLFGYGAR